jgi:hypothetical protein
MKDNHSLTHSFILVFFISKESLQKSRQNFTLWRKDERLCCDWRAVTRFDCCKRLSKARSQRGHSTLATKKHSGSNKYGRKKKNGEKITIRISLLFWFFCVCPYCRYFLFIRWEWSAAIIKLQFAWLQENSVFQKNTRLEVRISWMKKVCVSVFNDLCVGYMHRWYRMML